MKTVFLFLDKHIEYSKPVSNNSPVPSSTGQLVPEAKKKNIALCVIWQHKKNTQGCIKSTGTPDGRNIIIQTSELLQDDF